MKWPPEALGGTAQLLREPKDRAGNPTSLPTLQQGHCGPGKDSALLVPLGSKAPTLWESGHDEMTSQVCVTSQEPGKKQELNRLRLFTWEVQAREVKCRDRASH